MLEMLKERKSALEAQGKKGFTLMEMLIVIAIIAILIAIAIPLFTQQLDAARDAADESNGRALYAQLQADYMLGTGTTLNETNAKTINYGGTTYTFNTGATATSGSGTTAPTVTVQLTGGKSVTFPGSTTPTGGGTGGGN